MEQRGGSVTSLEESAGHGKTSVPFSLNNAIPDTQHLSTKTQQLEGSWKTSFVEFTHILHASLQERYVSSLRKPVARTTKSLVSCQ